MVTEQRTFEYIENILASVGKLGAITEEDDTDGFGDLLRSGMACVLGVGLRIYHNDGEGVRVTAAGAVGNCYGGYVITSRSVLYGSRTAAPVKPASGSPSSLRSQA